MRGRTSTVDRRLLQQALQQGQQISAQAASGQGFDPRGGVGVLAAQLATAGIGAWAQNKARKQLAEQEQQAQQAFSAQFPQFASLAGQLTPETRQALIAKQLGGQIAQQFAPAPTPASAIGKIQSDIRSGLISEEIGKRAIEKATSSSPLVEVKTGELEKQEQKELGKIFAKKFQSITESGDQARRGLETLQTLEQAVINPDAAQGAFAGLRADTKKIADLFGVEVKGLEDDAIIAAVGNKLALQLRNPKGEDGGLTGATSDRDIKFLLAGVPGRDKTREQNLALIEIAKKDKERTIRLKQLADQYLEEQGTFKGFAKVKKQFFEENPLFEEGSQDKERIKGLLSGAITEEPQPTQPTTDLQGLSNEELLRQLGL